MVLTPSKTRATWAALIGKGYAVMEGVAHLLRSNLEYCQRAVAALVR